MASAGTVAAAACSRGAALGTPAARLAVRRGSSEGLRIVGRARGLGLRAPAVRPLSSAFRDVDGLLAEQEGLRASDASLQVSLVQWYPGHIAQAERQLKDQLSKVDILLQVLDARIPLSTMHPEVLKWLGNKPQVLVVNRVDMVSSRDMKAWQSYLERFKVPVIWTNGKSGEGCPKVLCPDGRDTATFSGYIRRAMTGLESATTYALRALRNFVKFKSSVRAVVREAVKLSEGINAKRMKRGLQPRAVRAAVVGFPNVGKSALINRFLGRRTCASAPKPGVTRSLKWVRVDKELELLDSPGIIPGRFDNQAAASRLAMCNDIGEAAYVDSLIAAKMMDIIRMSPDSERLNRLVYDRYGIPNDGEDGASGEDFVHRLANNLFQGDVELAASRILNDYRKGFIGAFSLESPPRRKEILDQ